MLLQDGPLTSQPQEAVEVDEAHPSARGLITWNVGTPSVGGGGTFRPTGPQSVQAIRGLSGITGFDDASVVEFTDAPRINGGPFTALVGVIYNGKARPYTFISQGGAGSGYGWKLGMYPDGVDRRFALTYGAIADYAPTSGEIPVDVPSVIGLTVSGDAGTGRYYIDGKLDSSFAVGTMTTPASRDTTLGAAHANSAYVDYLGTGNAIWLALVWNRELSADEVAAISANPWQLFRVRQVVLPASAAPSADVAGAVALGLTATGSIAVAKPVSGTVAVALATSGSIAVAKPVAGGVGLALSATGAIGVNKPVAGAVAMGVACSGALTIPKPVAGSVAVGVTAAGSVAVAKPVAGNVAVALTTSGALTTVGMGGAVAVSVATAGSVAVDKPVSGAVLVSLTTAAALTVAKPVSGNVALSLATSGSVQVAKPVAGAVSVALTAAGAVQVPKLLGGAVSVQLTAGGSVAVAKPVGGAVVLSLTTTGRIETATLRGLVTAVLTLRSTPTTLTLRPTDATLTTRTGAAALTLRPAADAALQFQTDDPV